MAIMGNSTFLVVLIIAVLSVLLLGAVTLFIYYKQQRELIKKKLRQDSLLPTSLSEVKQLQLNETRSGRKLLSELTEPTIPINELEGITWDKIMDRNRKGIGYEYEIDIASIVFWGPIGSGKSSLLNSFSASIYKYYQLSDVAYQFFNSDHTAIDPFQTPSMGLATQGLIEKDIIFSRQFPKENKGAKVSSHLHKIVLFDNAGGVLTSAVDNLPDVDDNYVHRAKEIILHSDGIIVTLDPANYRQSRADYTSLIINLVNLMKVTNTTHYWAFCLTKMDLYPTLINNEPWDVLRELFGQELHDFIKLQIPANEVEVFTTSAFGFTRNNKPNVGESGRLANDDEWEPINVEFPFFWIFEQLEIKKLSKVKIGLFGKNPLHIYIRYPSQKAAKHH